MKAHWYVFMIALVMLSATQSSFGQSGDINLEIRVDSLVIHQKGEGGAGKFEYRFNVWLETAQLKMKISGVDKFPTGKSFSANNTKNRYVSYSPSLSVDLTFEAWEEDGADDHEYDGNDDAYCKVVSKIEYQNTEPGKWHELSVIQCSDDYEAFISYKWSPPKPPDAIKTTGPVCKNQKTLQFTVPNHAQKQYVTERYWERGKMSQKKTHPTESGCYSRCGQEHPSGGAEYEKCAKDCLAETPIYEDHFLIEDWSNDGDTFSYANDSTGLSVRYCQQYSSGALSDWSDPVSETDNFFKPIAPTGLTTKVVDAKGDEISTNLICETQDVKLVANMGANPPNDYEYIWYRGSTNSLLTDSNIIGTTTIPEYIDDSRPENHPALKYGVAARATSCPTKSAVIYAATTFTFQSAPSSIETVIKEASCENSKDGSISIESIVGGTEWLYYNIAGYKDDGVTIERTTIMSSPKKLKDEIYKFDSLAPGTYVVQLINGGGVTKDTLKNESFSNSGYCASNFEVVVPYRPPLALGEQNQFPVTCHGGSDGKIDIKFSNAVGALTVGLSKDGIAVTSPSYTVDTTKSTLTINQLPTGDYIYTINDSRGCLSAPTGNATVIEPAALDFTTTVSSYNTSDISCHGADDAFIEVTATGGNWTNAYSATLHKDGQPHRQIASFLGTTKFDGLAPGKYMVTVETVGACVFSKVLPDSITIEEPDYLTIDSVETRPITCHGVPNGEITVTSQGGTNTRQFRVDGGDWQVAVNVKDEDPIVGLDSGWHTVEVMDINGCVAPEPLTFHLTYPTPLAAQLDSLTMPLCYGDSSGQLFIRPSGGDPITQAYQINIRSIDSLVKVTQTSATYSANDPSNFPIAFSNLPSGNYAVTVIDPTELRYACSRVVDTVLLLQPPPIKVETVVINQPSCAGATDGSVHVKALGGTPGTDPDYYYSVDGVNYVAPNEAGVVVFTGLAAGNHTFYAVDGHHEDYATPAFLDGDSRAQLCSGSLDFTLDEPDLIDVSVTMQPVICYGTATGSITVDAVMGGRGGYTYAWEVLDTSVPNPNGYRPFVPTNPLHPVDLAHGTYRLTVRDSAGCQAVVVTEVTQPAIALTIDAVQTYAESCTGTADGKLQLFAKGGYPPYTYHIDHQAAQVYGLFDGLSAGAYLLTVRDQQGCAVQQLANVIADDLIVEVIDQIPTTIGAENGLIRLRATGGTNKQYYLNGVLSTTGSEFNGLAAGEHTIAVEYNGQCRWEQTYTIDEVDAPAPVLRVITERLQNVSCSGAQDGSIRVAVSGGIPPYALRWNDEPSQSTAERADLPAGSYTLMVTDAAGVTLDYSVTIDGPEPLKTINAVAASPTCHQGTDGYAEVTVVGGTAPYTYSWSHDAQQNTAGVNGLSAGTYSVTVTDQKSCSQLHELIVAATPAPEDLLEPQAITLCTGQSVTVDAGSSGTAYAWTSDNGFVSAESSIAIDQAGRYFLQVTGNNGCVVYDTLDLITTDNVIDAEFLLPTEILAGDTVVLTEVSWPAPEQTVWQYDENVTTYQSDGGKEYVVFPAPGEYTITLTVMIGNCLDQVEKKIIVSDASVADPSVENGRLGYHAKSEYLLYPNPNDGRFTLKISLPEVQTVRVSVYDPLFNYRYFQQQFSDTQTIEKAVDLTHLKHGVYALIIETPTEVKIIRFVIR